MKQREIPLLAELVKAKYVEPEIVKAWATYRDAVVWCWSNQRFHAGKDERRDKRIQRLFADEAGVHPSHMSRFVKADSHAPMNLTPDVIPEFEAFTGWRGVSQWLAMQGQQTLMEQVIQERAAA